MSPAYPSVSLRSNGLLTAPHPLPSSSTSTHSTTLERVQSNLPLTPASPHANLHRSSKQRESPSIGIGIGKSLDRKHGSNSSGTRFKPVPSTNFYGPSPKTKRSTPTNDDKENLASLRPSKRPRLSPNVDTPLTPSKLDATRNSTSTEEDELMRDLLEGLDPDSLFSPPGLTASPAKRSTALRSSVSPCISAQGAQNRWMETSVASPSKVRSDDARQTGNAKRNRTRSAPSPSASSSFEKQETLPFRSITNSGHPKTPMDEKTKREPLFLPSPTCSLPSPEKRSTRVFDQTLDATGQELKSRSSLRTLHTLETSQDLAILLNAPSYTKPIKLEHTNLEPNPRQHVPNTNDIDALMAGLEDEFGIESWDVDMGQNPSRITVLEGIERDSVAVDPARMVGLQRDGTVVLLGDASVKVKTTENVNCERSDARQADRESASEGSVGITKSPSLDHVKVEEQITKEPPPSTPPGLIRPAGVAAAFSPNLFDDFPFDDEFGLSPASSLIKPAIIPSSPQQFAYPTSHPAIHPEAGLLPGVGSGTPWTRAVVVAAEALVADVAGLAAQGSFGWGQKVVLLKEIKGCREFRVVLKDEFSSLVINTGDIVNVISPVLDVPASPPLPQNTSQPPSSGLPPHPATLAPSLPDIIMSLRNPENHIVLHPDILVPMTTLAGSSTCLRKGVLQGMVKSGGGATTKPLLYGNIIHEILQTALQSRCFSSTALKASLNELLLRSDMQLSLWSADLGYEEVLQEVWEKVEQALLTFGKKWVGPHPSDEAILHNSQKRLSLTGLHDVEESIWSVKWGLKGKVDASVQAVVEDERRKGNGHARGPSRQGPMPFEIKTGRAIGVMDHRAQTMLYTLLMAERYRTPVDAGLLYYTQTDSMLQVPAAKGEIRSLLHTRNELAGFLARQRVTRQQAINASQRKRAAPSRGVSQLAPSSAVKSPESVAPSSSTASTCPAAEDLPFLPLTIDQSRTCRSCYSVDACMLYRKAVDNVVSDDHDPIAETYQQKTGHLDTVDQEFFSRWENLISIEEQDIVRFKNQLWTMTVAEREKSGRCFADMILLADSVKPLSISGKADVYTYKFVRNPSNDASQSRSFLSGHIGKGDPVSLSIESDLLSIARAFVLHLTPTEVTLATDMKLDFTALLARAGRARHETPIFRVDKDEMLSGTARMRNNLAQLFYAEDAGGDEKRRRLVVHLDSPVFDETHAPELEEISPTLNVDQANAMHKVLTARDYSLILGMPGTGKTTTIAEIIIALVARGKSVLLTSYTHSAVDTILMKLLNTEQKILRLGNIDKIHPDVAHLALDKMTPATSLSQLDDRLMSPQIVATTCLSIDHPIFARRKFDYCIVDEASQITLPTCIGPLRHADAFVLVGDHFQLPPIVKNPEARRGGLDVSLFRLLSDTHPEAVVDLSYQYRMNADIMSLSNKLIYGDRLKCGSDAVARQRLTLPRSVESILGIADHCRAGSCWIEALLDSEVKAVFVDTDSVPAKDSRIGDLVQNEVEGALIQQIASCLTQCGIHEEEIAVITPYRQQIKLLTRLLSDMPRVEVMTADKSQGRDKDCILISMVRSNDAGNIGELLRDWRRINVSFTRAKKKLIIFGSRHTLQSDRLLSDFFSLMEEKKWIYRLAPGADEVHQERFPAAISSSQPKPAKVRTVSKGKLGSELLESKPFLREALREITNHCSMRA